jgi:hypothetical protein
MGPWQDWNPVSNPVYIKYQTIGTAPFRKLVVTFDNIPMFSCTSVTGRFQIVCNETTNTVENHILTSSFARGQAVQQHKLFTMPQEPLPIRFPDATLRFGPQ